jgi:hypothetical protein
MTVFGVFGQLLLNPISRFWRFRLNAIWPWLRWSVQVMFFRFLFREKLRVFAKNAHGPEKRRFGVFSGSKHEFSWCCRCYGQIALSLNRFWRVLVGFEHLARPVSGVMMYYGLLRVVKTRVLEWKWRVFGCFWCVLGVRVSLFGEIWCTLAIVNYSNRGCWDLCVRRPLFEGPEDLCSDQGPHSWLCE